MASGTNRTSPEMIETAIRRRFVLDLRKTGMKYADIADAAANEFGLENLPKHWDGRSAFKDVIRELNKLRADTKESAEDVRDLTRARYDAILAAVWPKAIGGNLAAIDRVLRISEQRRKLLGLDAPTKQELTGKDGGPIVTESRAQAAADKVYGEQEEGEDA